MKKYHYKSLNATLTPELDREFRKYQKELEKTIPGITSSQVLRVILRKFFDQEENQEQN